jgi:4-hydroxybenzoate polyprenyltransferase
LINVYNSNCNKNQEIEVDDMYLKVIKFGFFGNFFIGLLAIALNIEATLSLGVPFNSLAYYVLIFCAPVAYYNYAYMGAIKYSSSSNPRSDWFIKHKKFLKITQSVLTAVSIFLIAYLFFTNISSILNLPIYYWLVVVLMFAVAATYYGLLPTRYFNLNLRNTGWLKPFIIGFLWACTANILPIMMLKIESNVIADNTTLWVWLFIKNWMFCTVNAIMFDIKDYEIDANRELKTFVVRIGIHKTIAFILLPLLGIGMCSLLVFGYIERLNPIIIEMNLIPFVLTIIVAFLMYAKKNILFYLIVIDGLILVKALCGILAVLLLKYH